MKKYPFCAVLFFFISLNFADAGNMFGPGAFRNGSPLTSGNDGQYQATARATNVTGIIRFAYSGGVQTSETLENNWIFFINGQIYKGDISVAMQGTSLSGILDSGVVPIRSSSGKTDVFPIVLVSGGSNAAGSFQGKINLKSPSGEFSGSGSLAGASFPGMNLDIVTLDPTTGIPWVTPQIQIPAAAAANLADTPFQFRGVRASIQIDTQSSATTAAN
jgi:hypothetical protein